MDLAHSHFRDAGTVADLNIRMGAQIVDPDRVLRTPTIGADQDIAVVSHTDSNGGFMETYYQTFDPGEVCLG